MIARFATGRYLVTRKKAPTVNTGRVVDGATETFEIVASIQPLSGREAQTLPEGRTANDTRTMYTTDELITQSKQYLPDEITIGDDRWAVYQVSKWEGRRPSGSPHYVALIVRLEND